ncbi:hypothetical protein CDD82_3466 [Ophiocordyceps australis]|uniref:PPM-type phosphatase domain-containing protein n=1 Tax=Ophiocordyceps australis TaxID=1399860 RepID=A0A2C5ZCT7_9HYPO|nr:hypothetical protein CDD82_3466 [Ophiocordyceps australis]
MHRAALRAFRTTSSYINAVRGLPRSPLSLGWRASSSVVRGRSTPRPRYGGAHEPSKLSSMYLNRLPVALISSVLVGYGAWYSYYSSGLAGRSMVAQSLTSTQGSANTPPTRTVLVVGADEISQATLVGDGPISKSTSDDGRRVVEMLTPEQATHQLRRLEQSFSVNRGEGVTRYDLVQLPSNDPIEDDHAEKIVEVPTRAPGLGMGANSDWMFWGVFDGHSGWNTSATLRESLISYVAREINETYKASHNGFPDPDAIDQAIKNGFIRLDDDIVHKSVEKVFKEKSKTVAAKLLQPALSGSCALLSFYDSKTKLLRVACTGDSRAVLGRRAPSGKWMATALSEDQTGRNPNEVARMRKEHPGENDVVRNGRVLGNLEPTRAFGDAVYKWSRDVARELHASFFGRSQSPLLQTPPYVTAEPVITRTEIEPEKGDFLVLATDGLWEMLTNDEVVGLVGQWIETQARDSSSGSQFDNAWAKIFGSSSKPLPVEQGQQGDVHGQKTPIRLQQWGIDPEAKNRFIVKDQNVATHLVRNALGGTNDEQVCALLTLPSPFARRYRDDLTVQVIFFGNGNKTGEVTLNVEATAGQSPPKAKL